ncbi:protein TSSC4 [Morone saxatilis]|uniref:protein TSSC4 n=1 Tax=Morone saxatilis TaxID=34816 RepID=UPI0015E21368|nr:protein TSSC4 [Morone saxatilis]XP_035507956.1 protein TSSC4 [Morone saxatilis]
MCDLKNDDDKGDYVDELSASDESEPEEHPSSAPIDPELDHHDDNDDDREVGTSAPPVGHQAQSSFSLRGGGTAFSNRSHSIFDCLDSAAQLASSSLKQDNVTDGVFAWSLPLHPSRKTGHPPLRCPTPAKKRGTPDYLVHPERWTHYSLEDLTETSDQSNSRVAHHFLSSLQQRKEQQERQSDPCCNIQQKMIFSRPSGQLKEQPADQLSPVRSKEKETRLSHLEEKEEEEGEEGREKQKAGGKRTDQSVEKAEQRVEEKYMGGAVGQPEKKKRVQKKKGDQEEKIEEANLGFTSFSKTNRKNYRKSSGQGDN